MTKRKAPSPPLKSETPVGTTEFRLKATVHDNALFFRQGIAEGEATPPGMDPLTTELATNIKDGCILVTLRMNNVRRTYAFSPDTLFRAAVDKIREEPFTPTKEN